MTKDVTPPPPLLPQSAQKKKHPTTHKVTQSGTAHDAAWFISSTKYYGQCGVWATIFFYAKWQRLQHWPWHWYDCGATVSRWCSSVSYWKPIGTRVRARQERDGDILSGRSCREWNLNLHWEFELSKGLNEELDGMMRRNGERGNYRAVKRNHSFTMKPLKIC